MAGSSVQHLEMNVRTSATSKAFEEIVNEFGLEIANQACPHLSVDYCSGTAAEIHCRHSQGFVHRHDKVAGAHDAPFICQRLFKSLSQRDTNIFHGVVLIDIEVATGLKFQVKCSVAREQLQHMIEKTDPG